jgi:hypothetical protein
MDGMKPLPLLALVCIITGFYSSHTQAMTKQECIHTAKVSDDCHWSKSTGGRRDGWFDVKARKEVMPSENRKTETRHDSRPRAAALPPGAAMTTRNDHDLDHGLAASGSGDRSHSGNPDLSDRKIVPLTTSQFQIEDWQDVFVQRERTVLRDSLLIKAQTMMGK